MDGPVAGGFPSAQLCQRSTWCGQSRRELAVVSGLSIACKTLETWARRRTRRQPRAPRGGARVSPPSPRCVAVANRASSKQPLPARLPGPLQSSGMPPPCTLASRSAARQPCAASTPSRRNAHACGANTWHRRCRRRCWLAPPARLRAPCPPRPAPQLTNEEKVQRRKEMAARKKARKAEKKAAEAAKKAEAAVSGTGLWRRGCSVPSRRRACGDASGLQPAPPHFDPTSPCCLPRHRRGGPPRTRTNTTLRSARR